jgi:hypothetical protein
VNATVHTAHRKAQTCKFNLQGLLPIVYFIL